MFPNSGHRNETMDLRKEILGIQETFKIRLLSVVPATKGDMDAASSATSALES